MLKIATRPGRATPWLYTLYPRLTRKTQQRLLSLGFAFSLLATVPAGAAPHSPQTPTNNPYHNPAVQQALHQLDLAAPETYGDQFQVNSYTSNAQRRPDVAMDSDGDFVIVWHSYGSDDTDTDSLSIQAQRYDSAGTPQGSQFQVNNYTTNGQRNPSVSMDNDGDFVVVWQSYGAAGSDQSDYSIQAQRYNSLGVAQSNQFQVNTYTTSTQSQPDVALDDDGDFVITWQSNGSGVNDTSGTSIQARRYNSVGTAQAAQFLVNVYTTNNQSYPAVTTDSDGNFVIAWQSDGSTMGDISNTSVWARRYDNAGTALNSGLQINSYTTNIQGYPDVAADSDGDYVVVWHSYGSSDSDSDSYSIQAKRFDNNGIVQGAQFQVNTDTTGNQSFPAVAMDDDGDFIVAWQSVGEIRSQIFSPNGSVLWGDFQANTYTTSDQRFPAVAIDSNGDLAIAWQSYGSPANDNPGDSIQANQFDLGQTDHQVNTYTTTNQQFPSVAMDDDGDFVVVWESEGSGYGDTDMSSIQAQRYNSLGTAQGTQFQVNTYTTNGQHWPVVSMDSDGDFVVAWQSFGSAYGDTHDFSIQAQRYNSLGTAQGNQFQVNTYTTSEQSLPTVAMDSDGDFVVAWHSYGSFDGDDDSSIQGQRFNSLGIAQDSQFQVNTYTTNTQSFPVVSMDSDGDFVVVWDSDGSAYGDTDSWSIQAQRYNSLSTAQGSQFQVNTYTTSVQAGQSVAMDSDGDFVVAWGSIGSAYGDTNNASIQARQYNSLGTAQGSQFQVNTYTTNYQAIPSVAMDSDGDFVVVWESYGSAYGDAHGFSIQAQRFNSLGSVQDNQFQVNVYTTNAQNSLAVAIDSDGDFVVVWQSLGSNGNNGVQEITPDTDGYSIQAGRFNNQAGPVPTAVSLQAVDFQAQWPTLPGLLAGLGAILSGAWLWLRRPR